MEELLDPLIGTCRTTGEVYDDPDDPGAVTARIAGTDSYARLGAEFVVHRADVEIAADVEGLEVVGPISASPVVTRAYGSDGSVEESTLEVTDDGASATGEWRRDGSDRLWMTLRFTREA